MPDNNNQYAIQAHTLFNGERFLRDHSVIISKGKIVDVIPTTALDSTIPCTVLATGTLAPGFVDLQVNGGGGVMLNNTPTVEGVRCITEAHRSKGTTTILPTLISDSPENQLRGINAVREARASGNQGVLGVHLEGPFFNPEKRGAHNGKMIRKPEQDDIDLLCSLMSEPEFITLVTLAPEQALPSQLRTLTKAGIIVCAGHTNASYAQIQDAVNDGLSGFTHLFNAMRGSTAREPGVVGAALAHTNTWAGIIADGHHVHPQNIRLAHRTKAAGKLVLVSDAMATVGCDQSVFELYGEHIKEDRGRLVNKEGKLAGSAIGLIDAVKYTTQTVKIPLEECLRMASLYPATAIGMEAQLGKLDTGFRADMVHFDPQFKVLNSWLAGRQQSHQA